jgi:hypothetical protein
VTVLVLFQGFGGFSLGKLSEARRRRMLRRRRVRELRLLCWPVWKIAEDVGVCEKTVDRDLKTPGVVAWLGEQYRLSRWRLRKLGYRF